MKKRRYFGSKKHHHFIFNAFILFLSVGAIVAGALFLWMATVKVPDLQSFEDRQVIESTKIYDRTGEILLYDVHGDIKRTVIGLENISRNIKNATIAIEDSEFYEHQGIKPTAILRAILVNLHLMDGYRGQGGSTITQQVVKNSLLTPEKKISRKIKEWIIAIKLENVISKDRILELYLNEAPYGGSIYGVEEASLAFFGKKASDVTLAESAYLAALPQAPTYFSPFGNHLEDLEKRKNLVLQRMKELDFITDEDHALALAEEVEFFQPSETGIKAPHFVFFVRQYLEEKYGKDTVETGGLKVITTLDAELQNKAEEIVKEYALANEEKFNASNAGMVGLDPNTGEILVMVGSRDYFDESIDGNFNVTIMNNRQPGSAFKPFVYATAFKQGYTPDTVLFDVSTQFQTTCDAFGNPLAGESSSACYMPVNYDAVYRGPMTLRNALAQSVNIPAVKLIYLTGINSALQTAREMGITGLKNQNQYGLTLVLGGGEVSLLDITSAYGAFANEGVRNPYQSLLRVEDSVGNVLEEFRPLPIRVLPSEVAAQVSDVLSDNVARTPAFGSNSQLYFPGRDVAVKTGTTNDYRDAWTVGYTDSFVLGAWAGNNDNTSMEKKVAGLIITPMWNAVMQEVLKKYPAGTFPEPAVVDQSLKPVLRGQWQGGVSYIVDTISGKLATEHTPEETKEERFVSDVHSILHWVDKSNPMGAIPENPARDSQYTLWEIPVQRWAIQNNSSAQATSTVPTEYDDVHKPEFAPKISITSPTQNTEYPVGSRITVSVNKDAGKYPLSRIDVFVNGTFIGTSRKEPFSITFDPRDIQSIADENTLKVVAYDTVSNKAEVGMIFKVSF